MGIIKDFFSSNFGTPKGTTETEETKKPQAAEGDVVIPDTETVEEEVVEEMTLASVNAKVDKLIEVVDALVESMAVDTTVEEARIEEQVEANFKELVASLPKSKGIVPKSNGVLDKETNTYVPTGAKFRARMKEINSKTRN